MLFHTFHSQEERRKFGGSYFIEVQYCRLAQDSEITKMVSVDVIEHWKKDSLYIHGDEEKKFLAHYGEIFTGGVYNNGKSGIVDLHGINFYSSGQVERIMAIVEDEKEHALLLASYLERWQRCTI